MVYVEAEQKTDLVFGAISGPSSEATLQPDPNPSRIWHRLLLLIIEKPSIPGILWHFQNLLLFCAVLAKGQVITLLAHPSEMNWFLDT